MKSDRFTKFILVLIFLALVANFFKSFLVGEWAHAYNQWLSVETVSTRVRPQEYNKHYHKISCDCSGKFLKSGFTKEIKSSPPITEFESQEEKSSVY
jgi:hypothetical protein